MHSVYVCLSFDAVRFYLIFCRSSLEGLFIATNLTTSNTTVAILFFFLNIFRFLAFEFWCFVTENPLIPTPYTVRPRTALDT